MFFRWLLAGVVLGLAVATGPTPVLAEPGLIMVAGAYTRDEAGLRGELVPVFVPWDGVNRRADILSCLTGPFSVEGEVLTVSGPDRQVKLRFRSGAEGQWDLLETTGTCAGLQGGGNYRITETPMLRLDGTLDLPVS